MSFDTMKNEQNKKKVKPEYSYNVKIDFGISTVKVLKKDIETALSKTDHLVLKSDENCKMDLAGLQLIYALNKWVVENGKKLTLQLTLSEDSATMLRNAGFKIEKLNNNKE